MNTEFPARREARIYPEQYAKDHITHLSFAAYEDTNHFRANIVTVIFFCDSYVSIVVG